MNQTDPATERAMKLQVKIIKGVKGRSALVVCDEGGVPLPNQSRVELFNSVDDHPKVNITLVIDDDNVRLVGP
jgi:hypothetical protein